MHLAADIAEDPPTCGAILVPYLQGERARGGLLDCQPWSKIGIV
jgi:hypothetical protein